ncbi:MAG: hypothetical protein JSR83_02320 [Proteobacteria bacterium]|nr:hypothetical protein [Pseudomonadota bacterium]
MAETSVKYLHSALPGAPVLSGTAGSLIAVLDACLVNGWGLLSATSVAVASGVATATFAAGHGFEVDTTALVSGATPAALNGEQRIISTTTNSISWETTATDGAATGTITIKLAPAGWSKQFAGTNKAAYKSANPSSSGCLLRVDDTAAKYARVRGFESMTDVDTGVGPIPTDAQVSGGLYATKSNTSDTGSRRWAVIATDKFVHVTIAYWGTYQWDYALYSFGDMLSLKSGDAYPFFVCADIADTSGNSSPGNNNALNSYGSFSGAFIARSYTQLGGAIYSFLYKPGFAADYVSGHTSHPAGPNPINNSIDVSPTFCLEGSVSTGRRRGEIPGVFGFPHYLGGAYDSNQKMALAQGLPGHTLVTFRYGGYTDITQSYRFALDITGPWG